MLVAINGADGAGRALFADDLADRLEGRHRPVIRTSVDGVHQQSRTRYRRGTNPPVGDWLDSYDDAALRECLLDPLRPGGGRRSRTGVHDVGGDGPLDWPWTTAPPSAVLCLDGIFLHKDELREMQIVSVFLYGTVRVSLARLVERDGANADPRHPANTRHRRGRQLYLDACRPAERASGWARE